MMYSNGPRRNNQLCNHIGWNKNQNWYMGGRNPAGTVFVFPGRADYLEKYGGLANNLLDRNLNVVTIDWRGQGLSERLLQDRNIGHVEDFKSYQNDVAVMINYAKQPSLQNLG